MSRGPRRPPIISKKQQQRRRAIVIKPVSRIDDLREEQTCTSEGRRKEIVAELKQLRREWTHVKPSAATPLRIETSGAFP